MNKSCAVGSLVRLSVHSLIRMSVRPFVRPAQRRRRLAHPFARPTPRSVLHMCIYGLLNGGRLQIRRAVNQASSGPHRARTIPLASWWALLPARVIANKILGARSWWGAFLDDDVDDVADDGGLSRLLVALARREEASRSPVIYHKWIKCASERNNDPSCGNTWENPATIVLTANAVMEKKTWLRAWSPRRDYNGSGFSRNVSGLHVVVFQAGCARYRKSISGKWRQNTFSPLSLSIYSLFYIYYKCTVVYPIHAYKEIHIYHFYYFIFYFLLNIKIFVILSITGVISFKIWLPQ